VRLHVLGFPHTRVEAAFSGCAYTSKVLKFAKMMGDRHNVIVYAPEGPPVPGAELVPVITDAFRLSVFGEDDPNRLPAWPDDQQWSFFNRRAAAELLERVDRGDLVLASAGLSQKPIVDIIQAAGQQVICCEPGVGYEGVWLPYRAYESYAWMHHLYAHWREPNGRWFDRVIPNYFDADDFPPMPRGGDPYALFVGRLVARKGPHIAAEVANAAGLPLVIVGPGATHVAESEVVAPEVTIKGDIQYVGPVGPEERAELMTGAAVLLAPTTYIEPFGGVAVEAMMCGTPAVTTDWGAFTETVPPQWRFRSLRAGVAAIEVALGAHREGVRDYALSRYSLDVVGLEFDRWFDQLATLWGDGWYQRDDVGPEGDVPFRAEVAV